jgi:O-antigen ligase
MFHVKLYEKFHFIKNNYKFHELLFLTFVFLIPIQTRILYGPDQSYINWYFSYHLAFFVYLTDLLFLVCFIAWLIFDPPKIVWNRTFHLILLYIFMVFVGLLHVKHLNIGLYEAFKWLELFLIVIYVSYTFRTTKRFDLVLLALFLSGIAQSILAICQFHVQHDLNLAFLGEYIPALGTPGLASLNVFGGKVIRAYGTFPHPNVLAGFLVSSILAGYYLVSRATKTAQWLIGLGLISLFFGLFFTFSRIAWLAAALGSLVFIVFYFKTQGKRSLIIVLSALIVSCATIALLFPNLITNRVSKVAESDAVVNRGLFNHFGVQIMKQNPILGVGAGNYIPAMEHGFRVEPWQYQPPHNIFIFLGAELGIFGVALFTLILFEIFSRAWTNRRRLLTLSLLTIGLLYVFIGCFDHYFVTIQQGRLIFFTILGLILALTNLNPHETESSN